MQLLKLYLLFSRRLLAQCMLLLISYAASAQLSASFVSDYSKKCSPLIVKFTNTSAGTTAGTIYNWDFGNGNTSNKKDPGAVYTTPGEFTIMLTAKDGGFTSTTKQTITVYGPPEGDFTAAPLKECLPADVVFNSTLSGDPGLVKNYYWDFGDGNTQLVYTPQTVHTYQVIQDVTISLTLTNIYGCTKTYEKKDFIKILAPIKAAFSADKTVLCNAAQPIKFIDSSSGPGTLSYRWDFGDGTTSIEKDPAHVFNKAGVFSVSLTVTSSEGCDATVTHNSFINIASFINNFSLPEQLCSTQKLHFYNTSIPQPVGTQWHVNDVVIPSIENNALEYNFTDSGTYVIKLVNDFGTCKDSISQLVRIKKSTAFNDFIITNDNKCGAPARVLFKDTTGTALKWTWDFNYDNIKMDTNAAAKSAEYIYNANGQYAVRLMIENAVGCTSTLTKTVQISGPSVNIKTENLPADCGPYSLKFSALINEGSILNYQWNFGDGNTSTLASPAHLFTLPGKYTVTLKYTSADGCVKTDTAGVKIVYKTPVSDFTAPLTTICGNTPAVFNAVPQEDGIIYYWNFGDGTTAYGGPYATHKYSKDSTFSITLITISPGGCRDTLTRTAYIKVLPPFSIISAKANTCTESRGKVIFIQDSKKAFTWKWNFGDGAILTTVANEFSVEHTYTKSGLYKVTLTTTNGACSVTDTILTPVLLKQLPVLSADKVAVCSNGQMNITIRNLEMNEALNKGVHDYTFAKGFYSDGSNYNGIIADTSAAWGNNFTGTLQNFEKNKTGIAFVLKSAFFGCADTTNSIPLDVRWSEPRYVFINNNVCFKSPAVLKDSSATNNKIISWQWNFGDSTVQSSGVSGTVAHLYNNPGSYYAALTVTDESGCKFTSASTLSDSIYVTGPKAFFNPPPVSYITLPIDVKDSTNKYQSYATEYSWDFGDGNFSSNAAPVPVYKTPGEYTIQLIVKDALNGCADTASHPISIKDFKADFTLDSSYLSPNNCPPILVKLKNTSVNYTNVKWDFGDGTPAENLEQPSHIYEKPGKFIIRLYAYGPQGLVATKTDSVTVKRPDAVITVDKKEGCIGHVPVFKASVKNAVSFTWDFGDGTVLLLSDSVVDHKYNQPGTYKPFLVLTDSNGCKSSPSLKENIVIRQDPPVTFLPDAPVICRGSAVRIIASGAVNYQWLPAPGISRLDSAATIASPLNNIIYTVKIKDDIGCTNTDSVKVTVIQPLTVSITQPAPVCLGKTTKLIANGGSFYSWINKKEDFNNPEIAEPLVKPTATTEYIVTGSDAYRCFTDTAIVTVQVLQLPSVSIAPVAEAVAGNPISLNSITGNDVIKWRWSPAERLSCNTCPSPIATPIVSSVYTVTVTDKNGCSSAADVNIKMKCEESIVMIPNAFSPNNDGVNDVFIFRGISIVKRLQIYNRSGNVIFEKTNFAAGDRSNGWDGTYRGEPQPPGTYIYFAEIECAAGFSFFKKGTLVLVK